MTRAMLLCAGYGTRLGELTSDRPKPMLPVCDIAIVRYGVALLVGHGIRDIVVNTHHAGDTLERELGDGSELGARIQYSHEPEILGTGGGLKKALPLLDPDGTDEPFVSMNGKLIFDLDVGAVIRAYGERPDALGMMVVRRSDSGEYGAVKVDDGRVVDILGDDGGYMFCGVHVTRPSVMARLPDGEACSIRQGYLPWLREGQEVAAFEVDEEVYFAEHSTPERYLASNLALLGGARLSHPPGPLRGVDATAHVHSTAVLRQPVRIGAGAHIGEGAQVGPGVVVGSHAIVEDQAAIVRSVVWPGARARGRLADAVVTAEGATRIAQAPEVTGEKS
jgi:NDP-sugar pyrophosphorylase family protein